MPKWIALLIDPADEFAQGYMRTLIHFLAYGAIAGVIVTAVICSIDWRL